MALADEVVDVLVGVCTTGDLTKRVAEAGRLYADRPASALADPDLGPVDPQ